MGTNETFKRTKNPNYFFDKLKIKLDDFFNICQYENVEPSTLRTCSFRHGEVAWYWKNEQQSWKLSCLPSDANTHTPKTAAMTQPTIYTPVKNSDSSAARKKP